jgi:hypothetical protein
MTDDIGIANSIDFHENRRRSDEGIASMLPPWTLLDILSMGQPTR